MIERERMWESINEACVKEHTNESEKGILMGPWERKEGMRESVWKRKQEDTRRWTKNLNWNISEIRIVPGPKEARFPHLWHAGPTATSGPNHHHNQHRACHDYFRWAATASGIGDRLSRSPRPITITISAIMNKISPLTNTTTVLLFCSMKEQWPTGQNNGEPSFTIF